VSLDAIVLLGCRIGTRRRPTGAARRRTERAARAWREGAAPVIVVSGGRRWHGVCEADALRDLLLGAGVPARCVVTERRSRSTLQNARFAGEVLRARGATEVGIVTCDWHLRRALSAFRRLGFRVVGLAAPSPPAGRWRSLVIGGRERLSSVLDSVIMGRQCHP
jgi:uncharacterized SAM-binding protein YcdF (DUF218 family)